MGRSPSTTASGPAPAPRPMHCASWSWKGFRFPELARMNSNSISPMTSPLRGLLIAQFCGAFNDNAWKLMVALLAIRQLASTGVSGPEFETASQTQTTLAFVVFTFPLAVVSIVAGLLADRVSKRTVIILMKAVR